MMMMKIVTVMIIHLEDEHTDDHYDDEEEKEESDGDADDFSRLGLFAVVSLDRTVSQEVIELSIQTPEATIWWRNNLTCKGLDPAK